MSPGYDTGHHGDVQGFGTSSATLSIKRGSESLSDGGIELLILIATYIQMTHGNYFLDSYIPGETLSVSLSTSGGEYAIEVVGGAEFSTSGICSDSRVVNTGSSLVMPSTGK